MISVIRGVAVATLAVAMAGCALKAPPYEASISNVSTLKRSTQTPVRLGEFDVAANAQGATAIGIRGGTMNSPTGASYAAYLAEALKTELEMAKRLNPSSSLEVMGTLLGTDIDAGMSTGKGYIEARFVVKKDGSVKFDKSKRGEATWESSFVGAIAVPAAQKNYPQVVQNLLADLYADQDFQNALK